LREPLDFAGAEVDAVGAVAVTITTVGATDVDDLAAELELPTEGVAGLPVTTTTDPVPEARTLPFFVQKFCREEISA
jgi:hypothetical protein